MNAFVKDEATRGVPILEFIKQRILHTSQERHVGSDMTRLYGFRGRNMSAYKSPPLKTFSLVLTSAMKWKRSTGNKLLQKTLLAAGRKTASKRTIRGG